MNLNGKLLKTNTTLLEAQDFQSKVFLFFVTLNWQLYQESRKENNNNNQTGVLKWFQLFHYHFWQHDHLSFHSLHLNSAVCFLSYFISTSHCRRGVCVCVCMRVLLIWIRLACFIISSSGHHWVSNSKEKPFPLSLLWLKKTVLTAQHPCFFDSSLFWQLPKTTLIFCSECTSLFCRH